MKCEICGHIIRLKKYKTWTDAKTHYLHITCFNRFSHGKPRRTINKAVKDRENNRLCKPNRKKQTDARATNNKAIQGRPN